MIKLFRTFCRPEKRHTLAPVAVKKCFLGQSEIKIYAVKKFAKMSQKVGKKTK